MVRHEPNCGSGGSDRGGCMFGRERWEAEMGGVVSGQDRFLD